MIFASDLDRTLVFSNNSSELPENYNVIEYRDGGNFGFMESRDLGRLSIISSRLDFVPITSRSIEQLNRIKFDQHGVRVRYAVVDSGFGVYVDGKLDLTWDSHVRSVIDERSLSKLVRLVEGIGVVITKRFEYAVRLNFIDEVKFGQLVEIVGRFNHTFRIVSDRKHITVIFKGIDKRYALDYVCGLADDDGLLVVAGDSEFDEWMLEMADIGLYCGDSDHLNNRSVMKSGMEGYKNVGWVLNNVWELLES